MIKFLTKEGVSPSVIKQRWDGVYAEAFPSYSTVTEWAKQFGLGNESIEEEPRIGRPVEVMIERIVSLVRRKCLMTGD